MTSQTPAHTQAGENVSLPHSNKGRIVVRQKASFVFNSVVSTDVKIKNLVALFAFNP